MSAMTMRPLFATVVGLFAAMTLAGALPAQTPQFHPFPTSSNGATQKLVYDEWRGRMVRVDGSIFENAFSTWEWIEGEWSLRRTTTSPPPRSDFACGYDPVRRRVVLFGGRTAYDLNPSSLLDDTWEYDGIDWVQLQPLQRPTRQAFGWIGQDYAVNKLFLCGGINGSATYAAWHFDGTTWTQAPVAFLSGVNGGFASDPIRQRVLGVSTIGSVSLACEWDGTAWSWVTAAAWPTPRNFPRLTWVSSLQRIVMHGGRGNPDPNDLWAYDGVNWTLLGPAPVRSDHSLCHDARNDVLFVVGGRTTLSYGVDTLRWSGGVWTSHGSGVGWEDLRGAWFDGFRQRIVALSAFPLDWLEWDGSAWTRQPAPVVLSYPRGAFDPIRNRAVVVGSNQSGIVTQEWDGVTWTTPIVVGLPCSARPTFHPGRGKLVVSCGAGGLFEWNGTTWTQFAPGPGAPWSTNIDGECVYDAARSELVQVQWNAAGIVTGRWNGTAWNASTSTGPSPRIDAAMAYDPIGQRVLLFGGKSGSGPSAVSLGDLWQWDGIAWAPLTMPRLPTARSRAAMVFDSVRQQMVLFAGEQVVNNLGSAPCTDTWALDARNASAVQTLGLGCNGSAGPLRLVPGVPHAGAARFAVEAHGSFANQPCLFGFSFGSGAVPLGAGCTQWLGSQDTLMLVSCDGAGIATVTGGVPLSWHGTTWVAQAAVLDPSNALGVTLSEGVQLTAGHW